MLRATSIFILILLFLSVGALNLGGDHGLQVSTAGSLQEAQITQAALAKAVMPGNDLYGNSAQLRLKSSTPIPHVARTTPLNRHEGDVDQFSLARFEEKDNITISATLQLVTDHAYWYVPTATMLT